MEDCIFCKIVAGNVPSYKVLEDDTAYAFLDINPVNEYHTLVIPKTHCENVFDADADTLAGTIRLLKKVVDLYQEKLGINNLQIVSSSGTEAQQDVFHLHFHIVPRHLGDGQNLDWRVKKEVQERLESLHTQLTL